MRRSAFLLVITGMCAGCGIQGDGPLGRGATSPRLLAEGWLNGTAPSESELAGKVVVVDVWAHW